jgi:predicted nuclease of predicted toxin-antitoxin system
LRLLLDEMIAPRIARELRARGHDVHAIKQDRPELEAQPDRRLVERMSAERRAIVTNNVNDYRLIHDRLLAGGQEHGGMILTFDVTLPRTRDAIPLWMAALEALLASHPGEDALRNRVVQIP